MTQPKTPKLYVYLFRSRNKDNKDVPNFKERIKTILAYDTDEERVLSLYKEFVNLGVPHERTRLYKSVNARDEDKIREELIIRLIRDKPSLTRLENTLASAAQQTHNRAESKWLFDFDEKDEQLLDEFICDIPVDTQSYETPHGYAIVCEHGFDTRALMEKWKEHDITLKKDELLFLDMITKEG